MKPVQCDNCQASLLQGQVESHKKNECPEEMIRCSFSDQGCPQQVKTFISFFFLGC